MEETPYTLNEDLVKEIHDAFALYDPESSGLIDVDDLGYVMRALGFNYTEAELYRLAEELDEDYSGKIDFRSLLHLLTKKFRICDQKEYLVTAFEVIDRDGNNAITPSKLRVMFASLGEKITDEDLDLVFSEVDCDGDGVINLRDFLTAYKN